MASPQIEDGYLKISNKIIEELCRINLSKYEWRILLAIIRKTYGYNKKSDYISLSQLAKSTKIRQNHCGRAVALLRNKNIITTTSSGRGYMSNVAFQKDFENWQTTTNLGSSGISTTSSGLTTTNLGSRSTTSSGSSDKTAIIAGYINPGKGLVTNISDIQLLPVQVHTKDKRKDKRKDTNTKDKRAPARKKYLEFVFLSNKEYQKLTEQLEERKRDEMIETLNNYIGSTGKKYKSHYYTILNWIRRDRDGNINRGIRADNKSNRTGTPGSGSSNRKYANLPERIM